jgi:hypothetical protein
LATAPAFATGPLFVAHELYEPALLFAKISGEDQEGFRGRFRRQRLIPLPEACGGVSESRMVPSQSST